MPEIHSLDQKKADVAALADHQCPECHGSITEPGQSEAHAEDHWPSGGGPHSLGRGQATTLGGDAARRRKLLLQHGERIRTASEVK